jgi:hypothetical protein
MGRHTVLAKEAARQMRVDPALAGHGAEATGSGAWKHGPSPPGPAREPFGPATVARKLRDTEAALTEANGKGDLPAPLSGHDRASLSKRRLASRRFRAPAGLAHRALLRAEQHPAPRS